MNVNCRKRSKQMKTGAFLEMNPEWVRRPHNVNVSNNSIEVITERCGIVSAAVRAIFALSAAPTEKHSDK